MGRGVIASGILAGLIMAARLHAVVLHPGSDAGTSTKPNSDVVGRFGTNASAVAIAPNYILTTRHQGGGVDTQVVFGTTTYVVKQETAIGTADLRVSRIETLGGLPANLTQFTPIFTGNDTLQQNFTIGGFGRPRGSDLTATINGTYGYTWGSNGGSDINTTQRWGRNNIDNEETVSASGFNSLTLTADFDRPTDPTALAFESILAEFDSGGGWFVENGTGNWQVRAISAYVTHNGTNIGQPMAQALFGSNANAATNEQDEMFGIRVAAYASQINAAIPEPASVGLFVCGLAVCLTRRRRSH